MRQSSIQVTSSMASSSFDFSSEPRAQTHHARDTTTRNIPSLPPSSRCPQSFPAASLFANGQSRTPRHWGCPTVHHSTHFASNSSMELITGTLFPVNRLPNLNHIGISLGQGSVGIFDSPCIRLSLADGDWTSTFVLTDLMDNRLSNRM